LRKSTEWHQARNIKTKETDMAKKKIALSKNYTDVRIECDCGEFTLYYTRRVRRELPHTIALEAKSERSARLEAANELGCEESELPDIKWM